MVEIEAPDDRWDFHIICTKCGSKDKLLYITSKENGLIYCSECTPQLLSIEDVEDAAKLWEGLADLWLKK